MFPRDKACVPVHAHTHTVPFSPAHSREFCSIKWTNDQEVLYFCRWLPAVLYGVGGLLSQNMALHPSSVGSK